MPELVKLLDTYQGCSREWCEARLAEGWDGLIVGAWSGGYAEPLYSTMQANAARSLRNMREAGGLTAFYTNASPWYSSQTCFDETMRAVGDEYHTVSRIMLDWELPHVSEGSILGFIHLLRGLGKPIDGYSADWFLGMVRAAGGRISYPLDGYWYAAYNDVADLGSPTWRMAEPVLGHQYRGTTVIDGVACDLNVYERSAFAGQREVPMVIYTDPDGSHYLVGPGGKGHIGADEDYKALRRAGVPEERVSKFLLSIMPDVVTKRDTDALLEAIRVLAGFGGVTGADVRAIVRDELNKTKLAG